MPLEPVLYVAIRCTACDRLWTMLCPCSGPFPAPRFLLISLTTPLYALAKLFSAFEMADGLRPTEIVVEPSSSRVTETPGASVMVEESDERGSAGDLGIL